MPKVIVITGPCGAGKTTVSDIVSQQLNIPHLRGDHVKEELFPSLTDITKHPNELSVVKSELLKRAMEKYQNGESVVVDYVVLGDYIKAYREAFGEDLIIKVLLPSIEIITHRDKHRECWTAGPEHVEEQCKKFRRDEPLIETSNFIDNSNEPAEEAAKKILDSILLDTTS